MFIQYQLSVFVLCKCITVHCVDVIVNVYINVQWALCELRLLLAACNVQLDIY